MEGDSGSEKGEIRKMVKWRSCGVREVFGRGFGGGTGVFGVEKGCEVRRAIKRV